MIRIATCFLFLLAVAAPLSAQEAVSDSELETFLGLAPGDLDALSLAETEVGGDVTSGSAIKTTLTVAAGETFTAELNFLTDETPFGEFPEGPIDPEGPGLGIGPGPEEPNPFEDFLFASIVEDGVLTVLESVNLSDFVVSEEGFLFETGFFTYEHTFDTAGEVTIAFGVVDVGDEVVDSAFLLDELLLDGTPLLNGGFEFGDLTGFDAIGDVGVAPVEFFDELPPLAAAAGDFLAFATTFGGDIPEPSSLALIMLGSLLVSANRRR